MNKRYYMGILLLFALMPFLQSQNLVSKNGHIWFFSSAPLEDIEAHNRSVVAIFDPKSGNVHVSMFIKSFDFDKKLMQEHFNENYLESHTFPKADFKGSVNNTDSLDLTQPGTYEINVSGDLTIHGATQTRNLPVTLKVSKKGATAHSTFIVRPADHDIKIPLIVRNNIAKEIEVNVDIPFER
jgi:polyisoprenoid-binding protein YceI